MQIQLAIHNHRYGASVYHFVFDDDDHPPISEEYVIKKENVDFEPERDEDITFLAPIVVNDPELNRLREIEFTVYGKTLTALDMIPKLSRSELVEFFSTIARNLKQEGRL